MTRLKPDVQISPIQEVGTHHSAAGRQYPVYTDRNKHNSVSGTATVL